MGVGTNNYLVKGEGVFGRGTRENWSAAICRSAIPFRTLLGFSETARARDKFGAVERTIAVDIPALFQLIESGGLGTSLRAVHPLGVGVVNYLPLHSTLLYRNGGCVFVQHVDRAVDFAFRGFLVLCEGGTDSSGEQEGQA